MEQHQKAYTVINICSDKTVNFILGKNNIIISLQFILDIETKRR